MDRRTTASRSRIVVAAMVVIGIVPAGAQIPDEFTNLKVLPKDTSKQELVNIMRNFSGALGVSCTYCHLEKSPESVDFATDELEHKKVARNMMAMVGEINGRLMPGVGVESPMRVRCVTCHRGLAEPETLDHVLLEVVENEGVDAAIARYGELRERYFGRGAYQFGPASLNTVAEILAREKGDADGAIAVLELNVEHNPDAAYPYMMLGQLYAMKGNREAAKASLERSLELEPDNPRARQMLERLQSSE